MSVANRSVNETNGVHESPVLLFRIIRARETEFNGEFVHVRFTGSSLSTPTCDSCVVLDLEYLVHLGLLKRDIVFTTKDVNLFNNIMGLFINQIMELSESAVK